MKILKLHTAFILLGTLTLAMAATVDEQIAQIQNATPQKRVQLMNELKQRLSALGEEERTQAITKLRAKMSTNSENSGQNQIQETNSMSRMQNMQQHQVAGQAIQQGALNAGSGNKFMGRR